MQFTGLVFRVGASRYYIGLAAGDAHHGPRQLMPRAHSLEASFPRNATPGQASISRSAAAALICKVPSKQGAELLFVAEDARGTAWGRVFSSFAACWLTTTC